MIGNVEESTWRTVAAEIDGEPQQELIGQITDERRAMFAYRAEADAWANEQALEGFTNTVIGMAAVSYFGPTDSPSNCWSVTVQKVRCQHKYISWHGSRGECQSCGENVPILRDWPILGDI